MKICDNCYWCEKCAQEAICDNYDPINSDELIIEEYKKEIRLRERAYNKVLDEINADSTEDLMRNAERKKINEARLKEYGI